MYIFSWLNWRHNLISCCFQFASQQDKKRCTANLQLADCWQGSKGSSSENQFPSPLFCPLPSWVMSLDLNKGPATSSHHLHIPRLWWSLMREPGCYRTNSRCTKQPESNSWKNLTEKVDWTELFAFLFVTKGTGRVKLGEEGCVWV